MYRVDRHIPQAYLQFFQYHRFAPGKATKNTKHTHSNSFDSFVQFIFDYIHQIIPDYQIFPSAEWKTWPDFR